MERFDVSDEGTIEDYLGVKVTQHPDSFELTQPQLIDSILMDLNLLPDPNSEPDANIDDQHQKIGHAHPAKTKVTPAAVTKLIGPDIDGPLFNYEWNYRSIIGKLNYLEKTSRPDISFAVHCCARFMADPKHSYGEAVKHIGRYLLETRGKGIFLRPDKTKSFECFCSHV